ncbi:MAG: DUF1214 domain-containing protein [Sphingomonas sp.]|uniref:DUF1214 domain-containing protein n=1 Tax=Sphingomonas sp. TaxID=28214 RepID=UPI0025FC7B10|nr:DUF1214 domain-containing protein [Sphingomonas sp.]MBX3564504.1 DUF1214 domain-containing protein [Sphingomonas sp.]
MRLGFVARSLLCLLAGAAIGIGGAALTVRSGAAATSAVGPWTTGSDYGSAEAGARTRAVIALRGLLALPAREARYYNAAVDDAGAPLDGKCRYRIAGGALPARWWSITLYGHDGYLVANAPRIYAINSTGLPAAAQTHWQIVAAPDPQPGHWLPTGGVAKFELTLRAYLPAEAGKRDFTRDELPRIVRESCA